MTRVNQLTAEEAIKESLPMWRQETERALAQRLLYYALSRDENCEQALLVLSERASLMVDNNIALTLIEYALSTVSDADIKKQIIFERHFRMRRMELLTNTETDYATLACDKWFDPEEFPFDQNQFNEIINSVVGTSNLRAVFEAMRTYIGYCTGFLTPEINGGSVNFSDCFHPENFHESSEYQNFLGMETFDSQYLNALKFPGPSS